MKIIIKLLRYILFIPVAILAIGIVYWVFFYLLSLLFVINLFWLIVIFMFLGGIIWGVFKMLSGILIAITGMLSPNKKFSFWSMLVLGIIYGVLTIYRSWTTDADYSGKIVFIVIMFNVLVVELTWALIAGASFAQRTK